MRNLHPLYHHILLHPLPFRTHLSKSPRHYNYLNRSVRGFQTFMRNHTPLFQSTAFLGFDFDCF